MVCLTRACSWKPGNIILNINKYKGHDIYDDMANTIPVVYRSAVGWLITLAAGLWVSKHTEHNSINRSHDPHLPLISLTPPQSSPTEWDAQHYLIQAVGYIGLFDFLLNPESCSRALKFIQNLCHVIAKKVHQWGWFPNLIKVTGDHFV